MSGDIHPGDLVVCVDASPRPNSAPVNRLNLLRLREGRSYRVSMLVRGAVRLFGVPHDDAGGKVDGWDSARFRKIRPADEEFTTLIRKMKPVKVKSDA